MAKSGKSPRLQRRVPQRSNAKATVDAIFEAAARILRQGGMARFNTNDVAHVAGVSIGTLYGYFANKEAILIAMADRELDTLRDRAIAGMQIEGVTPLRGLIRALISGYEDGGPVRRVLMEAMIASGRSSELARPVRQAAAAIAQDMAPMLPPNAKPPSDMTLFVITRAVDSVIRAATYEGADFRLTAEFEDEIVALVSSYLLAHR